MSSPRLSQTSYVVLGLVELCQPATPYDLKAAAEQSTANFWSVPHTQLYTECARLAEHGLLHEQREDGGRRRRTYRLAKPGLKALDAWRAAPTGESYELRDPATLKLFFGADPAALAPDQIALHEAKLAEYEATEQLDMTPGMRLALEAGIGHEREQLRFWHRIARER